MSTAIILSSPTAELAPAKLFTPTARAANRVLEFFTTQINVRLASVGARLDPAPRWAIGWKKNAISLAGDENALASLQ
jgi:hypothetical protein